MHVEIQSMADDEVKICSIDHRRERARRHKLNTNGWWGSGKVILKAEKKEKERKKENQQNQSQIQFWPMSPSLFSFSLALCSFSTVSLTILICPNKSSPISPCHTSSCLFNSASRKWDKNFPQSSSSCSQWRQCEINSKYIRSLPQGIDEPIMTKLSSKVKTNNLFFLCWNWNRNRTTPLNVHRKLLFLFLTPVQTPSIF